MSMLLQTPSVSMLKILHLTERQGVMTAAILSKLAILKG